MSAAPRARGRYKRPLDLALLLASHLALAWLFLPLWIFIPAVIWLQDRGPIFYAQQRAGKNGTPFRMLKFRTMVPNADKVGPAWTVSGDHRVTPFGRVLRKTALDELPSLLSILQGHMSWVGPRALAVLEQQALEQTIPGFHDRLEVAPGLTGLSQIHNRDDVAEEKIRWDTQYIRTMSPWLDIRLIVLSVLRTFTARWDTRAGKTPQ